MDSGWQVMNPVRRDYRVVIDGVEFRERSVKRMFSAYMHWLELQTTPPPADWQEKMWRALASAYPKHIKRDRKKPRPSVSIPDAILFIRFMARRMKNKSLVAPAVADARAAVCSRCPKRAEVLGCSVCKQAIKMFVTPPYEAAAPEGCSACGCFMPLKVWLPRDVLGSVDERPYWEECWMRSEN